ncbi:hypothetical protein CKY28_17820 [Sphingomonas lenta]|uniref:Uncharacterized protein n=2 Tax=Sphingomonas lenta TaxID=1141887 RepID=A0A2A2SAQ6_9SPHN|nr:hypothetical protein CKY28_17820 [Sphingomonas lenta]
MPLGDNSSLYTTSERVDIAFNNSNDEYDTFDYSALAVSFYFGNGTTADDSLVNFGKNDTVVNFKQIFDGNGDGIVAFGGNGVLDIDRTGSGGNRAGEAQITVNSGDADILALRYLGSKGGDPNGNGGHVYADASTRLAGFTEGTVSNDNFNAATGNFTYFYDTALGLNLGGDTITGFGAGDRIVTTTRIHNGPDAGALITFGANGVLDLPGEMDGVKGDIGPAQGGQIDFGGSVSSLVLLNTVAGDGVTYYYYGVA